jgi:hypothetical protein
VSPTFIRSPIPYPALPPAQGPPSHTRVCFPPRTSWVLRSQTLLQSTRAVSAVARVLRARDASGSHGDSSCVRPSLSRSTGVTLSHSCGSNSPKPLASVHRGGDGDMSQTDEATIPVRLQCPPRAPPYKDDPNFSARRLVPEKTQSWRYTAHGLRGGISGQNGGVCRS